MVGSDRNSGRIRERNVPNWAPDGDRLRIREYQCFRRSPRSNRLWFLPRHVAWPTIRVPGEWAMKKLRESPITMIQPAAKLFHRRSSGRGGKPMCIVPVQMNGLAEFAAVD